jgi:hypothetical protein
MNKASQDMFEAPTFFLDHPKLLPFVVFGTAHLDKLTIAELLLNKGVNCNTFSDILSISSSHYVCKLI